MEPITFTVVTLGTLIAHRAFNKAEGNDETMSREEYQEYLDLQEELADRHDRVHLKGKYVRKKD